MNQLTKRQSYIKQLFFLSYYAKTTRRDVYSPEPVTFSPKAITRNT